MDKMKETSRIVLTVSIFLFIAWYGGLLNYNIIRSHETADPALPYVITADSRSLSLFSGYKNLENALGNYFDNYWCAWKPKLVTKRPPYYYHASPFAENKKPRPPTYGYFCLDPYGRYHDDCGIYNGVTTASTKEELEAAFGTDCIKTDIYYAEIFINGKEFNYSKKQDYPEDLDKLYYSGEWFDYIKIKYPDTETVTVIVCSYYDDEPNDIEFYIYPDITY